MRRTSTALSPTPRHLDADRGGAGPAALVTGGSRGIGAATCLLLAAEGWDVAFTYRNKATRAAEIARQIEERRGRALSARCDITDPAALAALGSALAAWTSTLRLVVLNASGGMERDLVARDPDYPMRINRDAQLAVLDTCLPRLGRGSTVSFVTSHWAHRYGSLTQVPEYEPVARSKRAGEDALRDRQDELAARGIRLLVVTGDLVEGTITAKLLERRTPGVAAQRGEAAVSIDEIATAIVAASLDPTVASGATIVVGAPLDSLGR